METAKVIPLDRGESQPQSTVEVIQLRYYACGQLNIRLELLTQLVTHLVFTERDTILDRVPFEFFKRISVNSKVRKSTKRLFEFINNCEGIVLVALNHQQADDQQEVLGCLLTVMMYKNGKLIGYSAPDIVLDTDNTERVRRALQDKLNCLMRDLNIPDAPYIDG